MVQSEKNLFIAQAKKRKQQAMIHAWLRRGIQLFFFLMMPSAFVAGFSGVKYIFSWIGQGQMLQLNAFTKTLIGLLLFTMVFGRYFCGYVCAFGSMNDFIYSCSSWIQKKLLKKKKPFAFPAKIVPALQKLKYLNLIFIVSMCALGFYGQLSGTSAWEVFSRLTALKSVPSGFFWGLLSFVLIVIGAALHERFFCQFLCPMGAVFALLPVLPFGMLKRNAKECLPKCNACAIKCPVGLKLEDDGFANGECLACERCTGVCPKHNIGHASDKFLKNPAVSVLAKAVLFFCMGFFLGLCRI